MVCCEGAVYLEAELARLARQPISGMNFSYVYMYEKISSRLLGQFCF